MTLRLSDVQADVLPQLQALWQRQWAPYPAADLEHGLFGAARDHGRQAVVAWRGDEAVGCAAWITFGVAADGCAYGSPVVAADGETAGVLIDALIDAVSAVGARHLRIGAGACEIFMCEALVAAGFRACVDVVHFSLGLPAGLTAKPLAGLSDVRAAQVDWNRLRACYADTFAGIANSPVPDAATLWQEWQSADWSASRVLADTNGEYQAFMVVCDTDVEAVGVREPWRGRQVARALYVDASTVLTRRGNLSLSAVVASDNVPSMHFHRELGCVETQPRRTVYELDV